MAVDLKMEPDGTDAVDKDLYRCVFSIGGRELEITSAVGQTIQLSLSAAASDRIDAEVHGKIRRLELEELRQARRKKAGTQ